MAHANYPHFPGTLYDCAECEARCHCETGSAECIFDGEHIMDKPTSAQTRRITDWMRDYARGHQGTASRAGRILGHETTRAASRMTHTLTYGSGTRAGAWVMVDPRDRTAWIMPSSRTAERVDGDARSLEALWTRTARESRYLDVLFDELEAQSYALLPGSETRESLEAYRATPRPEWLD